LLAKVLPGQVNEILEAWGFFGPGISVVGKFPISKMRKLGVEGLDGFFFIEIIFTLNGKNVKVTRFQV